METPSSTTRVTRSQTSADLNNSIPVSKNEDSEKSVSKTRTRNGKQKQERSALIDITNDSPIVGLAMETPTSAIKKQRKGKNMVMMMTPGSGSGEALLRGQVKSLLQKVEEEAEVSKVSLETTTRSFLHLQGCMNSPVGLVAPANTPNLSEDGSIINSSGLGSIVMALPVVEENLRISEVVSGIFNGVKPEEMGLESQKSLITRSLLLDFSEKSESSSECYSVVTGESSECKEKLFPDDDNASTWSIQVNASTHDEDEETVEELGDEEDYYNDDDDEDEEVEGDLVDELCEGLSKISMTEMFTGKHTRFVYNSDEEIEECDAEIDEDAEDDGVLRLKGLPTPKGKHLRFLSSEDIDD